MKKIFTSFSVFTLLVLIYSVLRLLFFLVNFDFFNEATTKDILTAFLIGIRFDISAIVMLNLPVLILYNLPLRLDKFKLFRIILFSLFCLLNILGLSLNIADFGYYPTIQRRLLYEPYSMLPDIIRMLPGLFRNYWYLIFGFLCASAIFIYSSFKFIRYVESRFNKSHRFTYALVWFILVILLSVIGIRGGLQLKPLRQTNAFFSDNRALGFLALNSTYTVLRSYFQYTLWEFQFYPDSEAKKILVSMIKSNDEEMLDDAYFFLRRKKSVGEFKKRNIVIFIMESWSAKYVGSVSGKKSFTPFFDSLARNGFLFTNFLASGQRSIEAVPSILASLPAVFPKSIIGSRSEINKIRGLGSILSEYGYKTSFHHGASSGSMGFDAFLPSAGFSNYYTKSEFKNYADSLSDGVWGIYDEPFFLDALEKIDKLGEPFCSVIFSLSSHDPMTIPDYRKNLFEKFTDESDFEKSVRYSDFALKQFFEKARKSKWFDNTIFIITADHTIYTTRNDVYEAYHVPLLIYAPKDLQPKATKRMGSHVDILPSILDLLNIPTVHSSMGVSLFDESKPGFAVVYSVPYFFYFKDELLYVDDFTKKQELFEYHSEKFPYNNSINSNKAKAEEMSRELKAYIQASTSAINKDLIYKK